MKSIMVVLVCTFSILNLNAQQAYVWEAYGISFTLADDFEEVVNNDEEFSAVGDGMEMAILPFSDENIDNSDIVAYTIEVGNSLDLERVDNVNVIKLNGFKGAYVEGMADGEKIFLMGLIDPDSDTNFFVIITFLDDDENAIQEAINICKSFKKI
jgi:hypothetical protein